MSICRLKPIWKGNDWFLASNHFKLNTYGITQIPCRCSMFRRHEHVFFYFKLCVWIAVHGLFLVRFLCFQLRFGSCVRQRCGMCLYMNIYNNVALSNADATQNHMFIKVFGCCESWNSHRFLSSFFRLCAFQFSFIQCNLPFKSHAAGWDLDGISFVYERLYVYSVKGKTNG